MTLKERDVCRKHLTQKVEVSHFSDLAPSYLCHSSVKAHLSDDKHLIDGADSDGCDALLLTEHSRCHTGQRDANPAPVCDTELQHVTQTAHIITAHHTDSTHHHSASHRQHTSS